MRRLILFSFLISSFFTFADDYSVTYFYFPTGGYSAYSIGINTSYYETALTMSATRLPVYVNDKGVLAIASSFYCISNMTTGARQRLYDHPYVQKLLPVCQALWDSGNTNIPSYFRVSNGWRYLTYFSAYEYISSSLISSNQTYRSIVLNNLDSISSVLSSLSHSLQDINTSVVNIHQDTTELITAVRSLSPDTLTSSQILEELCKLNNMSYTSDSQAYEALGLPGRYEAESHKSSFTKTLSSFLQATNDKYYQAAVLTDGGKNVFVDPDTGLSYTQDQLLNVPSDKLQELYNGHVQTRFPTNDLNKLARNSDQQVADIGDILGKLNGPLEVNVLNWPDNLLDLGAISNALIDALSDLNINFTNGVDVNDKSYIVDDGRFTSALHLSWLGYNMVDLPSEDYITSPSLSDFYLNVKGEFFHDIPNILMAQTLMNEDVCNMLGRLVYSVASNDQVKASTDQLQNELLSQYEATADDIIESYDAMIANSNLISGIHFIDTSEVLKVPEVFQQIAGDRPSLPYTVSFQLPEWRFGGTDFGSHSISIPVAAYKTYFDFIRSLCMVMYWALLVIVMFWLFRIFWKLIHMIPDRLCTGVDVR